ncbi:MAG: hypothetical protein MUE69_19895 [Myxococcota bacterium]|nr:hypothetical protein [Myxococcota bacterium]
MEPSTQIRGIAFRNLADAATTLYGEKTSAELLERARGTAFDALRTNTLDTLAFYRVEELSHGESLLAELASGDPFEVAFAVGHHGLSDHLPRVFRLFLRVLHPGFVLDRSTAIVRRYFDRGHLAVTRRSERFARLEAHDFPGFDRILWSDFRGATTATLEVGGARGTVIEIVEGGDGPDAVLEARWR